MKRDDFLRAFAEMSAEDQEAIRVELFENERTAKEGPCCPDAMKSMMSGWKPTAECREMMAKMKGNCC